MAENKTPAGLTLPDGWPEDFVQTPDTGLTEEEAARRLQAGEGNTMPREKQKSLGQILFTNCFTLFNGLNLALAICLFLVGSYRNMLFMGIVVANIVIGAVQEYRSQQTIRRLQLLNAPSVRVLRDGKELTLPPEQTVRGDLMLLRAGDQITADAIVTAGSGSAVEALLTGESDPVEKIVHSWLYSGSYVSEGRMTAQMVHVGSESYIGRLTGEARKTARPASRLMKDLNRLIQLDTIALVPLGILLFLRQVFLTRTTVAEAVPTTVAAMLGMIPEGLILLTSVAMAVGVMRLAKRQTLVQELAGIETLARVDVLCLDKTGTITSGEMDVILLEGYDVSDAELEAALSRFLGAFGGEESSTLNAMRRRAAPGTEAPKATLPFSSARKKSAASFEDGITLILGAPEFVLSDRCPADLKARITELAEDGKRVLVLAEGKGILTKEFLPPVEKTLGIIALSDQIRKGTRETLEYFREQGVEVKIISGDNPRTVSRLAKEAGLEGWDRWVDASAFRDMEELIASCEETTVFGRVSPEQKKHIIQTLRKNGHNVAMTGDGVNDIPALKAADCSIAMAGGSDAARHAAQLTLLSSDFTAMPDIVLEGRRVINNITRSASLFLTKTIFSFLLSVLMLFSPGGSYPFQPIQMTLVSGLMVGFPGFILALEPDRNRIQGHFLKTILHKSLPGGVAIAVTAALAMELTSLGWDKSVCATIATLLAGGLSFVTLARICLPLNRLRVGLLVLCLAGFVGAYLLLGSLFFLDPLSRDQWIALAVLFALGGLAYAGVLYSGPFFQKLRTELE